MIQKSILLLGLCSLLHAAFSAAQYRSYLRVSEQQFTGSLPLDIIVQAVLSLIVTLYSVVAISGSFKVIQVDDDYAKKRHDIVFAAQNSFLTFSHRGRILTRTH